MKSVFHQADRLALSHRLDAVTTASTPLWGRMDSRQMLAHLSDGVRMALGELDVRPKGGPLRFAPLRHAIIYWVPFPKGAPSAPELLARRAEDWDAERAALKHLLERLGALEGAREWPDHPAFGRMRSRDWGALMHKHVDHHLRQFGA
jgi:hypothetical protein